MKGMASCVAVFAALMLLVPLIVTGGTKTPAVQPDTIKKINETEVFRVMNVKTGKIENIGAYDYICGVVAAEEPAGFHTEALKAQAVAAFTYAVYRREDNLLKPSTNTVHKGADVCTDPNHCKAYLSKEDAQKEWGSSFDSDWTKISGAVAAVANKVMLYDNKPIIAVFSDMSSGTTESSKDVWGADLPYLTEVPSIGDTLAPGFESTVRLTKEQFQTKVKAKYADADFSADPSQWVSKITRSKAGGVISADICGKTITGENIRILLGLRSANFQVTWKDNIFTFNVKGYGHGVGMSQYGSDYLAGQGKKWDEILKWYYKGVTIGDYKWKTA